MDGQFDAELIEQIVQAVIRRLAERGVVVQPQPCGETAELTVTDKVVALATLEGRLRGVKRVVVGGRSIVTPAARDALRDKSIELIRR